VKRVWQALKMMLEDAINEMDMVEDAREDNFSSFSKVPLPVDAAPR
jgi:hypothetical protein